MRIIFDKYPQIEAGISERSDGSMVWWNRLPVEQTIQYNRDSFFKKTGIDPRRVVSGGIAHGTNIAAVKEKEAGKYLLSTDALITNIPNLFLSITAADCLPVFYFDPVSKSIGMIHAGWRGLIGGTLEKTIEKMADEFEARPENIEIIIGPHIRSCHYEVGEEVAEQFAPENIERRDGRLFADLGGEAERRLDRVGVKTISSSLECTFDDPQKFYSARRDKIDPLAGMAAYIGLR